MLVQSYNHGPYIEAALDSVLRQEVPFPHEILVGDDCSTDETPRIIDRLCAAHPGRIRLASPDRNLGANGNALFVRLLNEVRGEYVSILDGDDYWLEPQKMKRQVECLDNHPDASMSWHLAFNDYPTRGLVPYEDNFEYDKTRVSFTGDDLLFENFIPTCSVVFRRNRLHVPSNFMDVPAADWFMNVLLGEQGHLIALRERWGVRRVHPGGVISMKTHVAKVRFNIDQVRFIDSHFQHRYHQRAQARLAELEGMLDWAVKQDAADRSCG